MKRAKLVKEGGPPLVIVGEALELVRNLSWRAWTGYLLGTVPFLLGCCYFVADLGRSVDAESRLGAWSLVMTFLFLGCKLSQADLAAQLTAQLTLDDPPRWTWSRLFRTGALQLAVQSAGLLLYPIGMIVTLPIGWIHAFFQSLFVTGNRENLRGREAVGLAWSHATKWPIQNHWVMVSLSLLAIILFLNILTLAVLIPGLLKILTGVETTLSRNPFTVLNSTMLMLACGLTWMVMDPLNKAAYALRCFHASAIHTGDDLRASLAVLKRNASRAASLLVVLAIALGCEPQRLLAAEGATGTAPTTGLKSGSGAGIEPARLNQAMEDVLAREEFRWRLPGEMRLPKPGEKLSFWDWIWKQVEGGFKWVGDMVEAAVKTLEQWIRKFFTGNSNSGSQNRFLYDWASPIKVILIVLALVLLGILLWWLTIWINRRNQMQVEPVTHRPEAVPDLNAENVSAADLPVSGWWDLGARLIAAGDFRLAMRAFHLAGIAHLGERQWITIARFKSNRDYLRELERRGHALPGTVEAFRGGLRMFEAVWYGNRAASAQEAEEYRQRMEKIAGSGSGGAST